MYAQPASRYAHASHERMARERAVPAGSPWQATQIVLVLYWNPVPLRTELIRYICFYCSINSSIGNPVRRVECPGTVLSHVSIACSTRSECACMHANSLVPTTRAGGRARVHAHRRRTGRSASSRTRRRELRSDCHASPARRCLHGRYSDRRDGAAKVGPPTESLPTSATW